jgi:hypothetical protein
VTTPPLFSSAPERGADPEMDTVEDDLYRLDPSGDRVAKVLRDSLDQLLDGNRHGRWSYDDLLKTEKTHMGTVVEINLGREFIWTAEDDDPTDYRIADVPVDCKFSGTSAWMIGPELVGLLCLVIVANDLTSSWRAGLVRANAEVLRPGSNRDKKVSLTKQGVDRVRWLWPDHGRLEENLLLHLPSDVRDRIMSAVRPPRRESTGIARLCQLCREVQGRILRRAVVETVGHGLDDPMKRMRDNGGARDKLRPEGFVVLGHQDNDPRVAAALGLPVPKKGEFVAARVMPKPDGSSATAAEINGDSWVLAVPGGPITAAPLIPR